MKSWICLMQYSEVAQLSTSTHMHSQSLVNIVAHWPWFLHLSSCTVSLPIQLWLIASCCSCLIQHLHSKSNLRLTLRNELMLCQLLFPGIWHHYYLLLNWICIDLVPLLQAHVIILLSPIVLHSECYSPNKLLIWISALLHLLPWQVFLEH